MELLDTLSGFTESERQTGARLLRLATEIDRIEGYIEPHAVAVTSLATRIAERMGLHGADLQALKFASLVHDVGERALKRQYLLRRAPLTLEDRVDLARHPILGEQAASEFRLPRKSQLLIRWHHEWWNGKGYPDALAGEQIPLGARILRVADTWTALVSDRPFRPSLSHVQARRSLRTFAGLECDPEVVRVLLEILEEDDPERPSVVSSWQDNGEETFPFNPFLLNQVAVDTLHDSGAIPRDHSSGSPATSFLTSRARRWIGFELSVLRRIKFDSIAIPFSGRPDLEWHLNFWGKQIVTNDICRWAWYEARALFEGSTPRIDLTNLLQSVDDPGLYLHNPALRNWMNLSDARWFDRLWQNIQQIETQSLRLSAMKTGLELGDYVFSFKTRTEGLRRPLSEVFEELWLSEKPWLDKGRRHYAGNHDAHDFVKEVQADLCFIRLPGPEGLRFSLDRTVSGWRETWVRGEDGWLDSVVEARKGRLGGSVLSKEHYLAHVSAFLEQARHIPTWAIVHVDDGSLSAADLGDVIRQLRRRVDVAYSKDFTGVLGGGQAYIIMANA